MFGVRCVGQLSVLMLPMVEIGMPSPQLKLFVTRVCTRHKLPLVRECPPVHESVHVLLLLLLSPTCATALSLLCVRHTLSCICHSPNSRLCTTSRMSCVEQIT
jgi:hypothetical protein